MSTIIHLSQKLQFSPWYFKTTASNKLQLRKRTTTLMTILVCLIKNIWCLHHYLSLLGDNLSITTNLRVLNVCYKIVSVWSHSIRYVYGNMCYRMDGMAIIIRSYRTGHYPTSRSLFLCIIHNCHIQHLQYKQIYDHELIKWLRIIQKTEQNSCFIFNASYFKTWICSRDRRFLILFSINSTLRYRSDKKKTFKIF
jgi:hypothetical protein